MTIADSVGTVLSVLLPGFPTLDAPTPSAADSGVTNMYSYSYSYYNSDNSYSYSSGSSYSTYNDMSEQTDKQLKSSATGALIFWGLIFLILIMTERSKIKKNKAYLEELEKQPAPMININHHVQQ